ncbi:MAG: nickel pincer cofactor biosynthesis protein LarC [Acidimicrobiales bacterium]|nr:nickel pincer cofactor biosynthesis protein LarC [Acidimicrobiaceae bacterium]MXV86686.1 nickel pincer cofactor biosynthesis protein LarC [Acidimicrobiales bacterium]MXX44510.1 nickel pincer cofactor biosynthesis protein LarC [Acidimicrobiales bacterium]MYA83393.1 nickel pincer cofactor biosynthesis protein LarC [Acidimicrobiales bacterium]MYB82771.1 nickel pincer cofactor biosynthesis protein LarC [Acidimicrobiales bacterium]
MMHDRHGAGAPVVEPRPARAETTVPAGRQPSGDTVAWFDPVSGIAGDMALGALLDAGADLDFVAAQIDTLGLDGWKLGAERVTRNEIAATHAIVDAPEGHHHRRWRDIRELLVVSQLNERVRKRAMDVFEALAVAEGLVHGVPADEVHFHEVGALDAIVDIVGVCAALESLGVDAVCCGPVAVGKGTINAAHGVLPNPPPAVVNLLADRPIVGVDIDMELTTPTGAAIVAALAGHFGAAPAMTITSSGFGAGTRELPGRPNVTGVLIGTVAGTEQAASLTAALAGVQGAESTTELVELATNLDDVSGEVLGHAIDALLGAGALDAWAVPIVMKKGRPAYTLTALCRPEDVTLLADLAAQLTGTLGLRARTVVRTALERHTSTVDVDGHTIRVKHGPHRSKPEWEDVAAAAESLNRPPADIAREAGS